MSNKMKYKINIGFITQKVGGKIAIFSGEDSVLHTLNDTAAFIFQGLKLGWEDKKIIKGLMEKYSATQKQAEEDLKEFTDLLLKKKIIAQIK